MIRRLATSSCLTALVLVSSLAVAMADSPPGTATPTPTPNVASLHPQTVLLDINGTVTASSTRWKRLVVVGQDNDARPFVAANTTYAVVDIARHVLLSRRNTGGTIDNATIDEQRGLAYLTVETIPTRVTGTGTSYHIDLWTVDLRTGRFLSDRLFYAGEAATINAMAVDARTGHVFLATTRPGSGTYELMMIEPHTMALNIQSLSGAPDHIFVDSVHGRVIVTTQEGITATTSRFVAFNAETSAPVWSHLFTYILSSYANFTMVFNPRTLQIWSVAPGGLVSVVDAANGRVIRQIQMGYTRPDTWSQVGFALDTMHNIGYAQWAGAAGCYIDDANQSTAVRRTSITYTGYPCGVAASTLISVDEQRRWIVTADAQAIHVFDRTGHVMKMFSLVDDKGQGSSWFTFTTLEDNSHTTLVFLSDVAHQNQATGATTTGAAVFVPIS